VTPSTLARNKDVVADPSAFRAAANAQGTEGRKGKRGGEKSVLFVGKGIAGGNSRGVFRLHLEEEYDLHRIKKGEKRVSSFSH